MGICFAGTLVVLSYCSTQLKPCIPALLQDFSLGLALHPDANTTPMLPMHCIRTEVENELDMCAMCPPGNIAKGDSRLHTSIDRQLREGEACATAQQVLCGEPLSRGSSAVVKGMIGPIIWLALSSLHGRLASYLLAFDTCSCTFGCAHQSRSACYVISVCQWLPGIW